jgi:hypothetical protein
MNALIRELPLACSGNPFEAPPILERHDRFLVVRDDLLPGGTKTRALYAMMKYGSFGSVAYAGDRYGFGPIALANVSCALGIDTLLVFPDGSVHSPTIEAVSAFPNVEVIVDKASHSQNQAFLRAQEIASSRGTHLFPVGFDTPEFVRALRDVAVSIPAPKQAWSLAGSGCLSRALQLAWPETEIHAVSMGFPHVSVGRAIVHVPVETFDKVANHPPPYPSASYYDAKVWSQALQHGAEDALIWNVA